MEDQFRIYVEQLRGGNDHCIEEALDPAFLDIHEAELVCEAPVKIVGKAYLAGDDLIVHFDSVETDVCVPCSICNELVTVPIRLSNLYHSELLEGISTGVYNFKDVLRENILLEVPHFSECKGSCPMRKEIAQYLKSGPQGHEQDVETYRPFADLDDHIHKHPEPAKRAAKKTKKK